jgi:hypothetical protein
LKPEDRPQDDYMDGRSLIILTDAEGRWCVCARLAVEWRIVRPAKAS